LATLPPVNPESERAFVQNDIDMLNLGIRDLALEMNVPLADLEAAFYAAPYELPIYYYEGDWAHFNDLGYEIIANEWANIL